MRHNYCAIIDPISIRPLIEDDLELLRAWRNNCDISKYFRKINYIDSASQLNWYRNYLIQEDCLFWTIVYDEKVIGALSIYNINQKTAEIGRIMIGDLSARGKGLGYKALIAAIKTGFDYLGLETIYLSVHEKNTPALNIYQKAGFIKTGSHPFDDNSYEFEMSLSKQLCIENNSIYSDIVVSTRQ